MLIIIIIKLHPTPQRAPPGNLPTHKGFIKGGGNWRYYNSLIGDQNRHYSFSARFQNRTESILISMNNLKI